MSNATPDYDSKVASSLTNVELEALKKKHFDETFDPEVVRSFVVDVKSGSGEKAMEPVTVVAHVAPAKRTTTLPVYEDSMWPSQATQKAERRRQRRKQRMCRGCGWWDRLTATQRVAVKLAIFFLLVGIIVGVAVGVTAATHGGVWSGNGQSKPLSGMD